MAEIKIRPFQYGKSDIALIDQIEKAIFKDQSYESHSLRQMLDLFSELTFIAESNGEIIGYVLGGISADSPPKGWVLTLAVLDDDFFSSRLLLDYLIEELDSRGIKDLWLTADPEKKFIEDICSSLDFRPVEKMNDYFGPKRPRVLMRKSL